MDLITIRPVSSSQLDALIRDLRANQTSVSPSPDDLDPSTEGGAGSSVLAVLAIEGHHITADATLVGDTLTIAITHKPMLLPLQAIEAWILASLNKSAPGSEVLH